MMENEEGSIQAPGAHPSRVIWFWVSSLSTPRQMGASHQWTSSRCHTLSPACSKHVRLKNIVVMEVGETNSNFKCFWLTPANQRWKIATTWAMSINPWGTQESISPPFFFCFSGDPLQNANEEAWWIPGSTCEGGVLMESMGFRSVKYCWGDWPPISCLGVLPRSPPRWFSWKPISGISQKGWHERSQNWKVFERQRGAPSLTAQFDQPKLYPPVLGTSEVYFLGCPSKKGVERGYGGADMFNLDYFNWNNHRIRPVNFTTSLFDNIARSSVKWTRSSPCSGFLASQ